MTTGIFVPLQREVLDRLGETARQERRRPRDQAAVLLEAVLLNESATPTQVVTTDRREDPVAVAG